MTLKKCVIYTRTATEKDLNAPNSLKIQEDLCRKRAKRNGLEVSGVFVDSWISWLSTQRKWLSEMVSFLKQMKKEKTSVHFMVVTDMSRICRDMSEWLKIKQKIESFGVKICSIDCDVEINPETELYREMIMLFKRYERECSSRKIKAGIVSKKLRWPYMSSSWSIYYSKRGSNAKKR